MQVGEYYLPHDDIARRLQRSSRWVLDAIREGQFGHEVIAVDRDYMVPLSAFNAFVAARRLFDDRNELKPIYARSRAELVTKLTKAKAA